jgi:hypothetical protein
MWNCPYCEQPIALTWKRYFTEPGLKHTCPRCARVSRVSRATSPTLWLSRMGGLFLGAIPIAIVCSRLGPLGGLVGFFVGSFVIGMPIDKHLDSNYRKLLPEADEHTVSSQRGGLDG